MNGFKIGDWIYAPGEFRQDDYRRDEHRPVFQVQEIRPDYLRAVVGDGNGVHIKFCRLAENHEIPQEFRKQEELIFQLF